MENVRSKLKIDSLYVELAGLLLAAVLISGAFFFVLNQAGEKIITDTFTDSDYIEKMSSAYLDSLQKYIRDEQVASNDSAKLTEWVKRQKIVSIQVYKDEILTYDSNYPDAEVEEAGAEGGYYEWEYYYTVQFADGEADVFLYGFFAYQIYTYAMIVELLLAVVLLILIGAAALGLGIGFPTTVLSGFGADPRAVVAIVCGIIGGLLILVSVIWAAPSAILTRRR